MSAFWAATATAYMLSLDVERLMMSWHREVKENASAVSTTSDRLVHGIARRLGEAP